MEKFYWFSLFVAANGFFLLLLAVNISILRVKHKVSYGDGGNKRLMKAIRVHCNGTEQVPIFGLTILALTLTNASDIVLSSLVIVFTLSRFMHAYGMLFRQHILRQIGALVSYLSQVVAVVALLGLIVSV